jgi:eukaryotic-like serine/threonine-protein kinase
MSDEHLRPLNPGDETRPSQDGMIPTDLLPLDDLLQRDGMRWRDGAPSDRRLADLARQLATYAGATTLSATAAEDDDAPFLEPLPIDERQGPSRSAGWSNHWRALSGVAAAVVIVGLLATLLHGLAGSRAAYPPTGSLTGDCSSSSARGDAPAQVDWPQFGFGASGGRCNPYETRLSPANVAGLKLTWQAPGQFIDSTPAIVAGRIYVASIYPDSKLYVFDAQTGRQIWATPDNQPIETSSTSPAVADGMVLLGAGNTLEAFDAASGRLAWKFSADSLISTSPTIADGVAYVAFQDQHVYAFGVKSGKQLWKTPLGGVPVNGPIAVASHTLYISANALYALDRATGAIRWRVGNGPLNAPVVSGNTVYVSESDFRIHAFQADSGNQQWTSEPMRNVVSGPVSATVDTLYTGDASGSIWVLSAATGARRWTTRLPDSSIVFSSPAIANGVLYVTGSCDCGTSSAHFIFALRATNGRLLWQFAPGYPVYTSPVVANGYLYVATYMGLDAFTISR